MANEKQVSTNKDWSDYPRVALVCGIAGVLLMFISWIIFFLLFPAGLLGLLAIIMGVISLVRSKKNPLLGGRGEAIVGLMLGVMVLIIVSVFFWVISNWQD